MFGKKTQRQASKLQTLGQGIVMELFDVSPKVAFAVLSAALLFIAAAVFYFFYSAPPTLVTISAGPEGSVFWRNSEKYQKILEADGVKVKILPSNGSLENLQRLADPKSPVDVAFVQAGITGYPVDQLVSLGSVSYQPLLIFYRGKPIELLSELVGKKVAIGPKGSGTRTFALALLEVNGIKEGDGKIELLDWEGEQVHKALQDGSLDAAFMMSENTSSDVLRPLLRSEEIHLFHFKQASAYSRKIDYLNILDLPEGSLDFGKDIPPHDVTLLGPMVELVAKKTLHPALSDVLLTAAVQVHGRPGTYQKRGEFPAPIEHAIKISEDAGRFYKSGKSFLYRLLPFWIASLLSRFFVVLLPMLVVLIPSLKSIPAFFRWRTQRRIHRRYRELLTLERELGEIGDGVRTDDMRRRFDRIETEVNRMKIPASFADQFYGLRGHIDYVRQLVVK